MPVETGYALSLLACPDPIPGEKDKLPLKNAIAVNDA